MSRKMNEIILTISNFVAAGLTELTDDGLFLNCDSVKQVSDHSDHY